MGIDDAIRELEILKKNTFSYMSAYQAFTTAINIMCKYQKIFEGYEELTATLDPHDAVACSKKIDDFCIENMRGIIGEYYADKVEQESKYGNDI